MAEFLFKDESYKIIGAAMRVHSVLGCGFSEKVYQDAFEVELRKRGIPYVRERHMTVEYDGVVLPHDYYVDFLCYGKIAVELKAVSEITPVFKAQTINYLKAGQLQVGYLINFGETVLKYERFALFAKSQMIESD